MERKSNVINFPAKKRPAGRFDSIEVLISSLRRGPLEKAENRQLCDAISEKIRTLEGDLADDANILRRAVDSFVKTMASAKPGELSGFGVEYYDRSDPKRVLVSLANGESDRKEGERKISMIVDGSVRNARADLEFLKKCLAKLEKGQTLPEAELEDLRGILLQNSYWRFVEAV
jgi:hypothetical protein